MSDITLTATQRSTLLSLQDTGDLFNRTQGRLNSGKKVASVTDDAVAYFRAQSLSNRGTDISNRKTVIDQSVQSLNAALSATSAVEGLLNQLKGVLEGARGASLSQREAATTQFANIGKQLNQLVRDATYQGLNILTSSNANLTTQFSERTAATFTVSGFDLTSTAAGNAKALFTDSGVTAFKADGTIIFSQVVVSAGGGSGTIGGFSALDLTGTQAGVGTVAATIAAAIFTASDTRLDKAISQLQGISSTLGTNVAILQARSTFSASYANTLSTGSDKLTLADLNTEAANSQALQLRQQLGIQSLSVAGTQNQSILTLLK